MQSQPRNAPPPIDPETPISITMTAKDWNMVIEIMCRSTGFSYVQPAPLIDKVGSQMYETAEKRGLRAVPEAS